MKIIQKLQKREDINLSAEALEQEIFWDEIMAEHSKFIRGLLDPSENDLIEIANNFGKEFDKLTKETREALDKNTPIKRITEDNLKATQEIRNFKIAGTEGILNCKIKSIIIPLLSDHVLRESNHYLRLLNSFDNIK